MQTSAKLQILEIKENIIFDGFLDAPWSRIYSYVAVKYSSLAEASMYTPVNSVFTQQRQIMRSFIKSTGIDAAVSTVTYCIIHSV